MTAIMSADKPFRSDITVELDRIHEVRTARKLNALRREMNENVLILTGTIDAELKLKLVAKRRQLIEEADRLLSSKE